jgi:hypothetical protein
MPVLAEGMGPSAAAVVGLLDFLVIVAALVRPGRPRKSATRALRRGQRRQYRRPAALIEARQERGHNA